jgi:hypothetical protein
MEVVAIRPGPSWGPSDTDYGESCPTLTNDVLPGQMRYVVSQSRPRECTGQLVRVWPMPALTWPHALSPSSGAVTESSDTRSSRARPQREQLAEQGVDRVHGGVPGTPDVRLGLAVVACHPLGVRDAEHAVVLVEAPGEVADAAALRQDLVVGERRRDTAPGARSTTRRCLAVRAFGLVMAPVLLVANCRLTLAAHLSRLIATDLTTGAPPPGLAPYHPARFLPIP